LQGSEETIRAFWGYREVVVSVLDVAAYILEKHGAMSTMNFQKLAFYCQAWFLVWEDRPINGDSSRTPKSCPR